MRNLGVAAIALALSIVVARALGPSMKGSFDLLIAASAFAALAFGLGVPIGVTLIVAKQPELAHKIPYPAAVFAVVTGVVTVTVVGVWELLSSGAAPSPGLFSGEALAVGCLASVTVFTGIAEAALVGSDRLGWANFTDLIGRLAGLLLVIAVNVDAAPSTLVLAVAVGLLLAGGLQSAALKPLGWIGREAVATTVRQALPAYVSSGMQLLNYRIDLFILAFFWGPAEVGFYALAGLLAQFVWVLARGGATALYPLFAADDDPTVAARRVTEASRIAMLVGGLGAVALGLAAPFVVPTIYGAEFSQSVTPLWLLLPGAAIFSPAIVASAFFLGRSAPGRNVLASGVGLFVTVVLDLIMIPVYGMAGAAIASTVSYAATSLVSLALVRRSTGVGFAELMVPTSRDIAQVFASTREVLRRSSRPASPRNIGVGDR